MGIVRAIFVLVATLCTVICVPSTALSDCYIQYQNDCTTSYQGNNAIVTCSNEGDVTCIGGGRPGGDGSGGSWEPPTGGGSGGTGSGTFHPQDTTEEMREQSTRCVENDVQAWDADYPQCTQVSSQDWCCMWATNEGHLCTACNCGACCYSSQYGQTDKDLCISQCWQGWLNGEGNGEDDSDDCVYFGTQDDSI